MKSSSSYAGCRWTLRNLEGDVFGPLTRAGDQVAVMPVSEHTAKLKTYQLQMGQALDAEERENERWSARAIYAEMELTLLREAARAVVDESANRGWLSASEYRDRVARLRAALASTELGSENPRSNNQPGNLEGR